jgi:membrane protease YdiL (CAAX protease family)
MAVGCAALVLRPWLFMTPGRELPIVVLMVALGVAGAMWPVPAADVASRRRQLAVLAFGCAAFLAGRVIGGGEPPFRFATHVAVLNVLAAVAEEAFFRRFVYGALAHRGAAIAIAGSALSFAIVHLTVYGGWAMPLDITAGLLLSWQRWAAGDWRVPAATHVFANLLVVLT